MCLEAHVCCSQGSIDDCKVLLRAIAPLVRDIDAPTLALDPSNRIWMVGTPVSQAPRTVELASALAKLPSLAWIQTGRVRSGDEPCASPMYLKC